jgi:hypothetical protein
MLNDTTDTIIDMHYAAFPAGNCHMGESSFASQYDNVAGQQVSNRNAIGASPQWTKHAAHRYLSTVVMEILQARHTTLEHQIEQPSTVKSPHISTMRPVPHANAGARFGHYSIND